MWVSSRISEAMRCFLRDPLFRYSGAYHRFVKTTPKPRATKKRSGELVGPPPPPEGGADVVGPGGILEVVVDVDMVDEEDGALPADGQS